MTFDAWVGSVVTYEARVPTLGLDTGRVLVSLQKQRKENRKYFRVAFGLAVLLALATLGCALTGQHPGTVATFGVTTSGAVAAVMAAWKDKARFEDMTILALGLPPEGLERVLVALAEGRRARTSSARVRARP